MRRANATGRRPYGPSFVQLFHYLMDTPAWGELTAQESRVFLQLWRRYDGRNNGWLGLSVRTAAEESNINKDTAGKAFKRLEELGFIELAQAGAFDWKLGHSSEWRLTMYKCDRTHKPPSKAFMKWGRQDAKAGPK